MDRLKQELTGHDFDQLFDDVSSDKATFIANILSENYHSFRLFAQVCNMFNFTAIYMI